ncbi:MAG: hypothetical protein VKO64_07020 [Candidatus Sericytochromatia bacterium]|nr:hypothetical protein [Candidatus Sericytochromatia bacterium]
MRRLNLHGAAMLAVTVGVTGLATEARAQVKRSGGPASLAGPASLSTPAPAKRPPAATSAGVPGQVAEARGQTGLSFDLELGLGGLHGQAGTFTVRSKNSETTVADTADAANTKTKTTSASDVTSTTLGGGIGASYGLGLRWHSADGWGSSLRVDGAWLAAGNATTALGKLSRTDKDSSGSTATDAGVTTTTVVGDRLDVSSLIGGVPGASVQLTLPAPVADPQPAVGPAPTTTTFSGLGNLAQGGAFAVRDGAEDNAGTTSNFASSGGIAYRRSSSVLVNDLTAGTSLAVLRREGAQLSLTGGLTMPMSMRSDAFVQQTVDKTGKHAELAETTTLTTTADGTAQGSIVNGLNATSSVTVENTEVMFGPLLGAEGHIMLGSLATLYGQVGWAPALGGQGNSRRKTVESGTRRTVNTAADGTVTTTEATVGNSATTEAASGFLGQSARGLVGLQLKLMGVDSFVETGARTYAFGSGPQTIWNIRGGAGLTF